MSTIAGTTHIDGPVETVFEVLADPRNEPSCKPAILSVAKVTPGPIGVGAMPSRLRRGFHLN